MGFAWLWVNFCRWTSVWENLLSSGGIAPWAMMKMIVELKIFSSLFFGSSFCVCGAIYPEFHGIFLLSLVQFQLQGRYWVFGYVLYLPIYKSFLAASMIFLLFFSFILKARSFKLYSPSWFDFSRVLNSEI